MDIERKYREWLSSSRVNEEDKKTLLAMGEEEKSDAFFKECEFGTGGLRGVMGPGTNRVNALTISRVTVAFGKFLLSLSPDAASRGVVISHDNRRNSREFTLLSSQILNKMGLNTYIFDALRPTPELSFGVRYANAIGGIMITASHNPKQYNGYKVYDETGCQLVPDAIAPMLKILAALPDELHFEVPEAEVKGKQTVFGPEVDDEYVRLVISCQENPSLDKSHFKVVYTPQHGASYESAMRVFSECGYSIIPVKEQCVHDPDFAGTKSPNPEVAASWERALDYMEESGADLAVMTDPDGDRCGLAYRSSSGDIRRLTGNQSAALLLDYLLSSKKEKGTLPEDAVIYDTIVSSSQARRVAASYGVKCESFLTGFKFIGDRIHHYEKLGKGPTFVFGYEESYGCLIKPFVRDKDGVQAILLYTEMALFHKLHGHTLDEAYEQLQRRLGYHFTTMNDAYFEGMEGAATMKRLMAELHEKPLQELANRKVFSVEDYLSDLITYSDGSTKPIVGLPKSDVLKYVFADGSTLAIRPSGTEPKMKFYIETVGEKPIGLEQGAKSIYGAIMAKLGLKA